jgi:hypothetical protein
MAVGAICRDAVVEIGEQRDGADGDGFLPGIKVQKAAHPTEAVVFKGCLLESAYPVQIAKEPNLVLSGKGLINLGAPSGRINDSVHKAVLLSSYALRLGRRSWPPAARRDSKGDNEKEGEKEVTQQGVAEEKDGWGVTRVSDGECLKPARPGMGIEGDRVRDSRIEPPVNGVRDEIKESRTENAGAKEQGKAPASHSAEGEAEEKREGETKIPG